jgi:hypothetical protein
MLNNNIVVFWVCTIQFCRWARTLGGNILPPLLEKRQHASLVRLHDVVAQDEISFAVNILEYYADKRDFSNNKKFFGGFV